MTERKLVSIARDELYEKVWSTPMSRLCKAYQLSDNGLRKICIKMNVPFPPAGYWAKVQHGQNPPITQLPLAGMNTLMEYKLYIEDRKLKKREEPVTIDLLDVRFRDNLNDPHILIKQHLISVRNRDYHNRIHMDVDDSNQRRALIFLNNLFIELELNRIQVFREKERNTIYFKSDGCSVEWSIKEKKRRVPLEEPEIYRKFEMIYSGKLEFKIHNKIQNQRNTTFVDTEKSKLEDSLAEIVTIIVEAFPFLKEKKLEEERKRAEYYENQRRKDEEEKRQKEENRKFGVLAGLAESYSQYKKIGKFLDQIRIQYQEELDSHPELIGWLEWALQSNEENNKLRDLNFLRNFDKPKPSWMI